MDSLEQYIESGIPTGDDRGIAFFDLDRTLIAGYSIIGLALETARHGAAQGELWQSAKVVRDVMRHRSDGSGGNYHRLVKRVARALTGVDEATLQELGRRAYRNSIARSLYREAIALVEAHRAAGHRLVIVSAASRYQIEPIARTLGIDDICCTQLEVQDGQFTGQIIAPLCYGEGKVMAARRVARQHRSSLKKCWFYSDSSADLPLLRKVGHPVAVNPSESLDREASAQGWPRLQFETRGLPRLEHVARTGLAAQAMLAATAFGVTAKRLGLQPRSSANTLTRMVGDIGIGFAGLELEIEGQANLQRDNPGIYVFNHQSLLDSLVLAHLLRRDVVGFCKKEMAGNPLVGSLLRQLDTIFVDRDEGNQARVLKQAMAVLDSGRSLVIAPEGTRSTLGNIQPFRPGAFVLARRAGVPVIPIVLHNVKDALPKGAMVLRPATIRVTVLPPIPPTQITSVRRSCQELEQEYGRLLGKSSQAALPYQHAV